MPIQAIKEIKNIIEKGDTLSPSLRLTKYAMIGGNNEKKDAINFFVKAKPQSKRTSFELPNSETLIMKLGARMIINQAGGVLENAGLCIHRFFGYPYIPGSAVKGIARHAAWEEWFYERKDDAHFAKKIADTFGYPTGDKSLDDFLKKENYETKRAGSVSFLPATPIGEAKLETDVLTPHKSDIKNPVPLFFPVVKKGIKFKFTISPLRNSQNLKWAKKYLKEGLEENGVGAKTANGYGWFKEVDNG